MSVIVDAGVVCKLLFEEEGSESAQELAAREELVAPDLIYAEVGNVIWKRVRFAELSPSEAERAIGVLVKIPLLLGDSRVLLENALRLAILHGRTVYDCLYLALALARGEVLVTTDQRLINSLTSTELARFVRPLRSTPHSPTP